MSTVQLRLADSLVVRSITSDRFGRLFGFRVNNQNIVVVNLPASLIRDTPLTLTLVYSGRLEAQSIDGGETVALGPGQDQSFESPEMTAEPHYLYSNRMPWYPQALSTDFATATIKISVPPSYGCVASGVLEPGWPQLAGEKADQTERRMYSFAAEQPLRYLAFIVSKFARADARSVTAPRRDPVDGGGDRIGKQLRDAGAVGRSQSAPDQERPEPERARGRHRAVLRLARRRPAVSRVHHRGHGRQPSGRSQPGVLRADRSAAAVQCPRLAR